MRKLFLTLLIGCFSLSLGAAQTSNQYKHINYAWTQAGGSAPVCSSTTTNSCGINYLLTLTDPSGVVQPVINIAWPSTTFAYGPGGFLICGTWKASLVLNYKDDLGTNQSTTPITNTISVACPFIISPPSGFQGTPAP